MTIRGKKSLGQHFLTDLNICRKITRFADLSADDAVLEIGPGTGRLTQALRERSGRVTVVEVDSHWAQWLRAQSAEKGGLLQDLTVVEADVLETDFSALLDLAAGDPSSRDDRPSQEGAAAKLKIVGNLPYNIGTRIIRKTIPWRSRFHSCAFMLQKEVVDRIAARPGCGDYGVLSLIVQFHYQVEKGFTLAPGCFHPPPKVESALVRLTPIDRSIPPEHARRFEALVEKAFRHRRKTLLNNLKGSGRAGGPGKGMESCGVPIGARPQDVTLEQFLCLSRML